MQSNQCLPGLPRAGLCLQGVIHLKEVPIWEKQNLTIEEAAAYSNIGEKKLRDITSDQDCKFVLWVGNRRLIKKQKFDQYINECYSI